VRKNKDNRQQHKNRQWQQHKVKLNLAGMKTIRINAAVPNTGEAAARLSFPKL
jgi:hypothetical protein